MSGLHLKFFKDFMILTPPASARLIDLDFISNIIILVSLVGIISLSWSQLMVLSLLSFSMMHTKSFFLVYKKRRCGLYTLIFLLDLLQVVCCFSLTCSKNCTKEKLKHTSKTFLNRDAFRGFYSTWKETTVKSKNTTDIESVGGRWKQKCMCNECNAIFTWKQ